jgi:hypothetical protein
MKNRRHDSGSSLAKKFILLAGLAHRLPISAALF